MLSVKTLLQGQDKPRDVGLALASASAWLLAFFLVWGLVLRPPLFFPPEAVDVMDHPDARAVMDELVRICPVPDGLFAVRVPQKWTVRWHASGNHFIASGGVVEDGCIAVGFDGGGKPEVVKAHLVHLLRDELERAYAPGKVLELKPVRLSGLHGMEFVVKGPRGIVHQLEFHEAGKRYVFTLTVPERNHFDQSRMLYGIAASTMMTRKF